MKDDQFEHLEELFEAILKLETPEECLAFFKDICTYPELRAISQRFQVAKLLHQHHVFNDIVEATGASTATISRVNRALKDGAGGYAIAFERLQETEAGKESV